MVRDFSYPVELTAASEGGFVVRVPDVPEIVTQGEDFGDALAQAADALEEAFAGRIKASDTIPIPSPANGRPMVAVPPLMAAKAALALAIREAGMSQAELARHLEVDEKEVRRLLDPRHPSKLPRLAMALAVLGKGIEISIFDRVA
jgi:antitoxin HicB